MNEISTALKTLTDKITVKLEIGEKHFNVFLCIALCALGHLSAPVHSRGSFQNTTAWVEKPLNFDLLGHARFAHLLYYMIDPLKSSVLGAILFYLLKILVFLRFLIFFFLHFHHKFYSMGRMYGCGQGLHRLLLDHLPCHTSWRMDTAM